VMLIVGLLSPAWLCESPATIGDWRRKVEQPDNYREDVNGSTGGRTAPSRD
jgi:hypothetical protein